MRRSRLALLVLWLLAPAACGGGSEVIAGGEKTVTIKGGPFSNVEGYAQNYCERYGKRAVYKGARFRGPKSTKRLYVYDCVDSVESHDRSR